MHKPRALRPGDRVAVVAPASPFKREEFDLGVSPSCARSASIPSTTRVSSRATDMLPAQPRGPRRGIPRRVAGPDDRRAHCRPGRLRQRPDSAVARPRHRSRVDAKAFIGYSDNTSVLSWLTLTCGIVSFHGPMIEGRLAEGEAGYDRDTFARCLCRAGAGRERSRTRTRSDSRPARRAACCSAVR